MLIGGSDEGAKVGHGFFQPSHGKGTYLYVCVYVCVCVCVCVFVLRVGGVMRKVHAYSQRLKF